MLRWLTAGESHGPALVAVLEGVPAGVEVTSAEIGRELARRRLGYGRGARMTFEQDEVEIIGGVRHGVTLGSPVAIRVGNSEWPKWETVMAADPGRPRGARRAGPQRPADPAPARPRRPGRHAEVRPHRRPADPGAGQRPGDGRPGRRRHGRQGAAAAGARHRDRLARGRARLGARSSPACSRAPRTPSAIDADPLRCLDPEASAADGRRGRRGQAGRATPSAASSRCWPTAYRRAWAATSSGTASWTPGWPRR